MLKFSKSQKEEIEFFSQQGMKPFSPTLEEMEEYINETVYGNKAINNRISESKRRFDITIAMWRKDLTIGLLGVNELREDFKYYPYALRIIESLIKSVTKEYRMKTLLRDRKLATILAITNFPKVLEDIKKIIK